jgi:hypothetical protein
MHSILRLLRCGSARVHRGDRVASFSEGRGQAGQERVERGPGGEAFHFRCFMMNVIFDVGCSYGERCTEP